MATSHRTLSHAARSSEGRENDGLWRNAAGQGRWRLYGKGVGSDPESAHEQAAHITSGKGIQARKMQEWCLLVKHARASHAGRSGEKRGTAGSKHPSTTANGSLALLSNGVYGAACCNAPSSVARQPIKEAGQSPLVTKSKGCVAHLECSSLLEMRKGHSGNPETEGGFDCTTGRLPDAAEAVEPRWRTSRLARGPTRSEESDRAWVGYSPTSARPMARPDAEKWKRPDEGGRSAGAARRKASLECASVWGLVAFNIRCWRVLFLERARRGRITCDKSNASTHVV
ncbi:hypothetical protein TRVL_04819 [Trypanosoma vivax]|nr:hypothetical protein TRVL_04819 [Trypanosoma vivax]